MRIAVSLLSLRPGRVGGAETYVRRLVAELPQVAAPGDTLIAVMDREVAAALETPRWERAVVDRSARAVVVERLLEAFTPYRALAAERAFREAAADVVLFPQQSIFPKRVRGKVVVSVGDVQHLVLPENIPPVERLFRAGIYPYSMRRADHLVAISEFTRRTLVERCAIAQEKITAIPHGHDARPGGPAGVPPFDHVAGPYLYYPAATFPHKNHAELIRSYAVLRRRGDVRAKLVFTGMQTPAWKGLARLARDLGVAGDVVHLGFLRHAEVQRVFASAEAVLFPSRYEGFGIPVIEAAAEFGKKVVTSRLAVFDEIGVPPDWQIDFSDPEALLGALRRPGPTVLLVKPATWRECARRTAEVLRLVASTRAAGAASASAPRGQRA